MLIEPVMANCGIIPPAAGYLQEVRRITEQYGVLLIFDEVMTGFRVAPGGAQEYYGVRPDISTFAKAIGAGFPLACFGGTAEVMGIEAATRWCTAGRIRRTRWCWRRRMRCWSASSARRRRCIRG